MEDVEPHLAPQKELYLFCIVSDCCSKVLEQFSLTDVMGLHNTLMGSGEELMKDAG